MRAVFTLLLLILFARPAFATWSVIALDQRTGTVVIASATCVTSKGLEGRGGLKGIQAIVVPGVGIAAAQAGVDSTRANQMLIYAELQKGTDPAEILKLLQADSNIARRQFAIIDMKGRMVGFSGERNGAVSLHEQGRLDSEPVFYSIQGNILKSDLVVRDAVAAFKSTTGSLTDRVMAAMEAADKQGGDSRCTCATPPVIDAPCDGKTAHVAYILRAEKGDKSGSSHSDGEYAMYINVTDQDIKPTENANPVKTLRMRHDAWKKTQKAPGASAARALLAEARDVAAWLRHVAQPMGDGMLAWAGTPGAPSAQPIANLYSGSAGVVLFFLELHHATGDAADLATARAGADWLLTRIDAESQAGLYTGLAGIGFTLTETWKATKDARYRDGANRVVDRLKSLAKPVDNGVEWLPVSDIISGTAGIGLYLLSAARDLARPDAKDLAVAAGRRLLTQHISVGENKKWAMTPAKPARLYPNFSHGTAGIAYFLGALHQATGDRQFLDAALAGARYLVKVARTEGDVCLVFHYEPEPDGLDRFYLSWCHGPAGTGRLFHQLAAVTGDREWRTWLDRSARGIRQSGIPERETTGFWNNVGQCCGSAGVADFFLSYHELTRNADALAFTRQLTDQILAKATRDSHGTRWVHAEHRVQPQNVAAQTGWMQGAAGLGAWLIRLDGFERGRKPRFVFPDTPFGR